MTMMSDRFGRVARGAAVSFLVMLAVLFGPTIPGVSVASQQPQVACAADGSLGVAVVVDFGTVGDVSGAPPGMIAQCVQVAPGATGLKALQAAGLRFRTGRGGLICAIADYPKESDGCAEANGDHFRYWSYWSGSAEGWTYQNTGAGTMRVKADRVEGWRFVDAGTPGSGTGPRPPRNILLAGGGTASSSVATNVCHPPAQTPTSSPATTPITPAPPSRDGATAGGAMGPSHPTQTAPLSDGEKGSAPPRRAPSPTTTVAPKTKGAAVTEGDDGVSNQNGETAARVLNRSEVTVHEDDSRTGIARYLGAGVAGTAIAMLGIVGVRRANKTRPTP